MIKEIQAKTLLSTATHPDALFGIKYTMNLSCKCSHRVPQHAGSTPVNSGCLTPLTPNAAAANYFFDALHVAVAIPMHGGLLVLSQAMKDRLPPTVVAEVNMPVTT